uniref:Serine/threonine-protein kinase RIO1 n=1 Tax=Romanomermis culicivorax TaxID=13658 RepID=A0A915IGL8_ROMCU
MQNTSEFASDDDSFGYSEDEDTFYWCQDDSGNLTRSAAGCNLRAASASNGHDSKSMNQHGPKLLSKYYNKISVDKYNVPMNLSHGATNKLLEHNKMTENNRVRVKDKQDRATVEQVLDPRTRMILFKLLSKNIVTTVNGCISTGKEANVYHAFSPHGYCKGNPRKMVATWAEKEMRNLLRIRNANVLCPEPAILKGHVLVMEFLGIDGWPSPVLKEAQINDQEKIAELHFDIMLTMRRLYRHCKLVHADLSEYNLIYHNGKAYVIDVSQAVEHDHPHALEFLRKDCENIIEFFRRKQQDVLFVKELFSFITDPLINDEEADGKLKEMLKSASERQQTNGQEDMERQKIEDEFFKKVYIPKKLEDVEKYEKDINDVKEGKNPEIFYPIVTGLNECLKSSSKQQNQQTNASSPENTESEGESDSNCELSSSSSSIKSSEVDEGQTTTEKKILIYNVRARDESPNTKRERKNAVKEMKREKRKTKIPKNVKKRKEKLAKANSKRK